MESALDSEFLPVRAGRDSSVPLKQASEECNILVSHSLADLLHSSVIALEQAFGSSNSQLLQIRQRAVSCCLFEAANEIAQAHSCSACRSIQRKRPMEVLMQPI